MSVTAPSTVRVDGLEIVGTAFANGVAFKGVPFAEPPVGKLRFRPPQPYVPRSRTIEATRFGRASLQFLRVADEWTLRGTSEDCLTLNVWTPELKPDTPLAVMLWIHGGAFTAGSSAAPSLDGGRFARDGVVFVSCNYRVGALGFTHLGAQFPELAGSGNLGLLDQRAALTWVRSHIAAFGGDPTRITVFGCSAGAMSVASLLSVPDVARDVDKAVLQSGAGHCYLDADTATVYAERFCRHAAVTPGDVAALQGLTSEAIMAAYVATGRECASREVDAPAYGVPFAPVVDGLFLKRPPISGWRNGSARHVKLLVGSNREEWQLFSHFALGAGIDAAELPRQLQKLASPRGNGSGLQSYRTLGVSDRALINRIETDRWYRIPAIRLAEAQLQWTRDVRMYRFAWQSAVPGLGACHGIETPFVFENFAAPEVPDWTGADPPLSLARAVHAAWVSFAKNGVPNAEGCFTEGSDPSVKQSLADWPVYDANKRATMEIGTRSAVIDDPDGAQREAWVEQSATTPRLMLR